MNTEPVIAIVRAGLSGGAPAPRLLEPDANLPPSCCVFQERTIVEPCGALR